MLKIWIPTRFLFNSFVVRLFKGVLFIVAIKKLKLYKISIIKKKKVFVMIFYIKIIRDYVIGD